MIIALPDGAAKIINTLAARGREAYIVGGCLRDILLGQQPHDWDIATDALPEEVIACFAGERIIKTGLKHGTVTVLLNGEPYEVTTYRIDKGYSDNRHPDAVVFSPSLDEDLARRDFTINALAYNPACGLVDLCHGREDLNKGEINCVGEPGLRFKEDALRLMRALRFASALGFEIGEPTSAAIHGQKALLKNIAAERLNLELCGLLCGRNVRDILINYADVLAVFIPELEAMRAFRQNNPHHHLDLWEHTAAAVAAVPADRVLRLAMLFHDIAKPQCYSEDEAGIGHYYGHPGPGAEAAGQILRRLKFDNQTIKAVKELIFYHDAQIGPGQRAVRRWLNRIGEERLRQLLLVKEADIRARQPGYQERELEKVADIRRTLERVLAEEQCFSLKDLAVKGGDLLNIGIGPGKQVGLVLRSLLELVVEGELANDKESLLEAAEKIK